jgi:hypothetical protein
MDQKGAGELDVREGAVEGEIAFPVLFVSIVANLRTSVKLGCNREFVDLQAQIYADEDAELQHKAAVKESRR